MRDALAAQCIGAKLTDVGYRYGGPIFNFPSPGPDVIEVDTSFLRPDDLLVLATRPPLDDLQERNRYTVQRSFTSLEEKLFRPGGPLRGRFEYCSRPVITLTDATSRTSREIARRQTVEFFQHAGPPDYQGFASRVTRTQHSFIAAGERPPRTAAYLVYADHAWPGGPGLFAAFSISGTETLVWAHYVATERPDLICSTPFAMAELETRADLARPHTMDFADGWKVTVLGQAEPEPS